MCFSNQNSLIAVRTEANAGISIVGVPVWIDDLSIRYSFVKFSTWKKRVKKYRYNCFMIIVWLPNCKQQILCGTKKGAQAPYNAQQIVIAS